jgi:hypothetical protein
MRLHRNSNSDSNSSQRRTLSLDVDHGHHRGGARLPAPGTFTKKTKAGVVDAAAAQRARELCGCSLWQGELSVCGQERALGAGRWAAALATVTEWGCRSLMVFNVAACGLRLARAARGGGAQEPPHPPVAVGRKCTHTSQGRAAAAAWLNFLCIDVDEMDGADHCTTSIPHTQTQSQTV